MLQAPQINLSALFNLKVPNNQTNRNAPRQPSAVYQLAPRQPYQSNLLYFGYQKNNKKGVYQITDKDTDLHPKGFYTTFEQEDGEVLYSNEGFEKVDANFVDIESSCGKCGAPFSSKSLLHKHPKDGYISSLQASLPGTLAPISPIPIITSKFVVLAVGSGLAF